MLPSNRTLLSACAIAALSAGSARAFWAAPSSSLSLPTPEPQAAAPAPSDAARRPDAETPLNERLGRDLARLAVMDLQSTGSPEARDYRIAALALEIAHERSPRDQHILRLLIDAWSEAGDDERVLEHTAALIELDGKDTVAQLRLIAGRIAKLQNVDARLKAYEQLLGPKGKTLDASVRSRLALDAALLLRERGDAVGFADKLTLASSLDSTNKDAASLAATFYSMQTDDPVGRFQLLINLLNADPLDPQTHLAMARELAAAGDFPQASRFYQTYQSITSGRGQQLTPGIAAEYQMVQWRIEGAEKLVTKARVQVETERATAVLKRRELLAADAPPEQIPDPEDYRLQIESERVRAAAAAALGDAGQLDYASEELETTFARYLDRTLKTAAEQGATEEDLAATRNGVNAELLWMRLWMGRSIDRAATALDEFAADQKEESPTLRRMRGWLLLRRADLDGAEALLSPLAADDPFAALGLGLIEEARGKKPEAGARFEALYLQAPGTLVGAFAHTKAKQLLGREPARPEFSGPLAGLADGVPTWVEGLIQSPQRISAMVVRPVASRIGAMDSALLRVTLTNLAPIPLGVGAERAIGSTILLAPRLTVGLQVVSVGNAATVVRLDRRLRLLPQEAIEADVWADAGLLGYVMDQAAVAPAEVRWRLLQNFVLAADGTYMAGPESVMCESGIVSRDASPKASLDGATLTRFIQNGSLDDVIESMLVVKYLAQNQDGPQLPTDVTTPLAEAIAARYPTLPADGRLTVIAKMPPEGQAAWLAPADQAFRAEADPTVLFYVLLCRVSDPADALLAAAAASPDRRLAEAAGLMRARLEEGVETLSRLGRPKPPAAPSPGSK